MIHPPHNMLCIGLLKATTKINQLLHLHEKCDTEKASLLISPTASAAAYGIAKQTLVLSKTTGNTAKLDWRHVLKSDGLSLLPGPLFPTISINRNHKMPTLALTEGPNKLQASVTSLWRLALFCPCTNFGPTQVLSRYCEIVQDAPSPFRDKCSQHVQYYLSYDFIQFFSCFLNSHTILIRVLAPFCIVFPLDT